LEEGTKELDRQLSMAAMDHRGFDARFSTGKLERGWSNRFMTSSVVAMTAFGAGYCYLKYIEPAARMRVARVAGPLPLAIDVIRLARVVGVVNTEPLWLQEVGGGALHVQYVRPHASRSSLPTYQFMSDLVTAVLVHGWSVRIGIDGGYDPFAVSVDKWAIVKTLLADDSGYSEAVVTGYKGKRTALVKCSMCGFSVNPVGHEERCAPGGDPTLQKNATGWDNRRLQAWLNDVRLKADVMLLCVAFDVASPELESVVQSFITNSALASYWRRLPDVSALVVPAGSSDHCIGTAFECSYSGHFRRVYLEFVMAKLTSMSVGSVAPTKIDWVLDEGLL